MHRSISHVTSRTDFGGRGKTGAQFRFLYRNWCSTIAIPPMIRAGPILGERGLYRLHHWLTDGKNVLVVGGGDANIAFINGNCIGDVAGTQFTCFTSSTSTTVQILTQKAHAGPNGGFSLEAERVRTLLPPPSSLMPSSSSSSSSSPPFFILGASVV
jgi:hypothetical protein